jgi:nitrous oxide reductase
MSKYGIRERKTIMRRRTNIIAATALVGLAAGVGSMAATTGSANASGTTLQTVSKTETIVSAKCYTYRQVTRTYYHWSSTKGWELYPSPKVTVTTGETCHA